MVWIVFLRAANVGGHQVFRPAEIAKKLATRDVVNVGTAGTFVVRKPIGLSELRKRLQKLLPFEARLMICRARDLEKLVEADPFRKFRDQEELRSSVSILEKRLPKVPELPLSQPEGKPWQVRVLDVQGQFVLAVSRRVGKRAIYPNEVVEKCLGVAATTRTWETLVKALRAVRGT